jgi:hypothetical protein
MMTIRKLIHPGRLPEFGINLGNKQRKRLEDGGLFPRRVPVSERTHAYVEDEILTHTQKCIARRDGECNE